MTDFNKNGVEANVDGVVAEATSDHGGKDGGITTSNVEDDADPSRATMPERHLRDDLGGVENENENDAIFREGDSDRFVDDERDRRGASSSGDGEDSVAT